MRTPRLAVASTTLAVALSVVGCAAPAAPPATWQAPSAVPVAGGPSTTPPGTAAPSDPSCPPGTRWDCAQHKRFTAAAMLAADQPGQLAIVVSDRTTGAVWRTGPTVYADWTASTIKLAIATLLLERHRAGEIRLTSGARTNLDAMLTVSSNEAAHALWTGYDGPSMLERFRSQYGMSSLSVVPGYDPYWRHLRCTVDDLHRLMSHVLDRTAPEDRAYLVGKLRSVAANQRWGVWAAGSALRPGNKNGWASKPGPSGTHWVTHSVGFAGPGERYVVAVTYSQPPSGSLAAGVHAVSDVVATVLGTPVPARVSLP